MWEWGVVGGFLALLSVVDGSVRADFGICRRRRWTIGGRATIGRIFWRYTPVPPEDHSCVGRNLTVSCRHIWRIRHRMSPTMPKITNNPQVDHSCEGRNLIAMGGIAALITPPLAANEREIPAYAGMVFQGDGGIGGVFWYCCPRGNGNVSANTVLLLPAVKLSPAACRPPSNCRPPHACRRRRIVKIGESAELSPQKIAKICRRCQNPPPNSQKKFLYERKNLLFGSELCYYQKM